MTGVKRIEKLKRAVVNRQAQNAHIVGIHHPVAKAYRLPLRQHVGCALAHGLQKVGISIALQRGGAAAFWVVAVDDIVCQLAQLIDLVACGEMLKMAKAQKAGSYAGHDRCSFHGLACNRLGRANQRQSTRGRDAKRCHGFAAEKFSNRRAQHGAAIAHA